MKINSIALVHILSQPVPLPTGKRSTISRLSISSGDVVLMTTARDEEQWQDIVLSCKQSQAKLLMLPADIRTQQLVEYIQHERATVLMTTAQRWREVFQQLNKLSAPVTRLKVILTDTKRSSEPRTAFVPKAFSQARLNDTYEAFRKLR